MFRKTLHMNALEMRRELLVAESGLNRARLLQEWRAMAEGVRGLAHRVSAFRRSKTMPAGVKPSWFHTILKGAQLAGSIWFAFRARSR